MQRDVRASHDGATVSALAQRVCVVVHGMHRSGTSAMTRVISLLGADLPRTLLAEGSGNLRGHWEPAPLVAHHDRLLDRLGSRWDDWRRLDTARLSSAARAELGRAFHAIVAEQYPDSSLFVLKDPRICRFVPLVVDLLAEEGIAARHVLMLRNPLAVAYSLAERNGITAGFAALMWLRHMLDAEAATRAAPRAIVSYESLLTDWRAAMRTVGARVSLRWPCSIEVAGPQVEEFLSTELQHHAPSRHELAERRDIAHWVKAAYGALRTLERDPDDEAACATLDSISAQFDAVAPAFAEAIFPELDARDRIAAMRQENQEREVQNLRSTLAEREAEVTTLRTEIETARREAATAHTGARLTDGVGIERLHKEFAQQKRELEVALRDLSGAKQQLSERTDDLHQTTRELDALRVHVLALEAEAQRLSAKIGRRIGKLRTMLAPPGTLQWRLLNWVAQRILVWARLRGGENTQCVVSNQIDKSPPHVRDISATELDRTRLLAEPYHYQQWIQANEGIPPRPEKPSSLSYEPLISVILPVYKVPVAVLKETLQSLVDQIYPHWQACIAYADTASDENWQLIEKFALADTRFSVRRLERNQGIAINSNECLAMAQGEYIALLDHDDVLSRDALYRMAVALNADPTLDFLYSDKDSVSADGSTRLNPLFKPGWSPEMLYSVNYLTHLNLIRRSLVAEVGGFRAETDGAQDWDLFLRVTEKTSRIRRVEGVLYHWRILPTSTSTGIAAKPYALTGQLRAVNDHLKRLNVDAEAVPNEETGFRIAWRPKVRDCRLIVVQDGPLQNLLTTLKVLLRRGVEVGSVAIVTSRDDWQALCDLTARDESIKRHRLVPCFTANGAEAQALATLLRQPCSSPATVITVGNLKHATEGWLEGLAGWVACHPEIGFASAVALCDGERVLEAGSVVDGSGNAFPLFRGEPLRSWGVFGGPLWHRNVRTASPYLLALKSADLPDNMSGVGELSWHQVARRICGSLHEAGLRGVVDPNVRVTVADGMEFEVPPFDSSVGHDPYFHPAFSMVTPLLLGGRSASNRSP